MKSDFYEDTGKSNIVIDDDRLNHFKDILNEEYSRLIRAKTFQSVENLDKIIHEVTLLKSHYVNVLPEDENENNEKSIENNLKTLYDGYFNGFPNDATLMDDLYSNSGKFFNLKKLFQLSRIFGIINEDDDFKKRVPIELQNYLHFIIFLDYFESFPRYLRPVLKHTWETVGGHVWFGRYQTRDYYNILYSRIPNFIIEYDKIKTTYRILRNDIAHSSVFFQEDIYEIFISPENNKIKSESIEETMDKIRDFETMAVIYATEFDLRVLQIGLNKNDIAYDRWINFFEIYNECWQKIGPPIDSKND